MNDIAVVFPNLWLWQFFVYVALHNKDIWKYQGWGKIVFYFLELTLHDMVTIKDNLNLGGKVNSISLKVYLILHF